MKRLLGRIPTREAIAAQRWARPLAPILRHDSIWAMNRRAVSRGIALGLFCGTIIPFGQSFGAALVAVPLRANLAVAALCTFITNPFTTPFFYLAGYQTGSWLLDDPAGSATMPKGGTFFETVRGAWNWLLSASAPTLLGLLVIATLLAFAGWLVSEVGWRAWTARRWRARRLRRPCPTVGPVDTR